MGEVEVAGAGEARLDPRLEEAAKVLLEDPAGVVHDGADAVDAGPGNRALGSNSIETVLAWVLA